MTECLDQLRDNRSAINSPGIMDNSSVIAQGESGTRERESCFCESSRLFGGGFHSLGFELHVDSTLQRISNWIWIVALRG